MGPLERGAHAAAITLEAASQPGAGKVDGHLSVIAEARKTGLSVDDDGNLTRETAGSETANA